MIRMFGKTPVFVAVISARRPDAMKPMTELIGDATWFVDRATLDGYCEQLRLHDLGSSVIVADGLCEARNAALNAEIGDVRILQLSDDLRKLEEPVFSKEKGKYVAKPLDFDGAVRRMALAIKSTGAALAGVAPTSNPFYYRGKSIHPKAFIVGDMIMTRASCPLRFDETLRLKEDYDFTLQHLEKYGMVARCDDILATFLHGTNAGGAVAYRDAALEQATIAQLRARWGNRIADNPKRPNEILLKLK